MLAFMHSLPSRSPARTDLEIFLLAH
ncbi:hypothetical protein PLANTIT3_10003 [Plantibacter sp. T3]|nr:hypothetical protein PLANTIT3_10003 [Plantibacter sp. T3]